jgi:CheY-like chemotaxis protein
MSSEQNLSESPAYQEYSPSQIDPNTNGNASTAPGMGQSKSSRRRRRKRKSKLSPGTPGAEAQSNTQNAAPFAGDIQAGGQSFAAAATPQQNYNGGAQQQPGQAGKRWKKKFRDRQRGGQENPGNQASGYSNGNGHGPVHRDRDSHQPGNNAFAGGKRKGKQRDRGPRGFVGPMDHSYRAVSGNFAEGPAATIDTFGGRGGGRGGYVSDSQPIDYSVGRPIPIAEDAPTRIYFFIEDLFFNAKITESARKLGVKVAFLKNEKEALAQLTELEEADRPGLIVFDLNSANVKPLTLIPKLKTKLKKSTSIIGFLQHIQGDLKAKAVEAGCDTVMPRAAFSQNLPNLLRRYGTQEEEDNTNYNM